MELFQLVNHKVSFSPQALLLQPFKDLWDRDTTKDKSQALNELGFVYYYCAFKSDFSDITNDMQREAAIKELIDVEVDDLVRAACKFYKQRQHTISTELLRTAKKAINKMSEYFDTVDFTEQHPKTGKLIHDLGKTKASIDKLGETIKGLNNLEQQVKKELEEAGNMKGSRIKKAFEDGSL
jgi:hypothetical protein